MRYMKLLPAFAVAITLLLSPVKALADPITITVGLPNNTGTDNVRFTNASLLHSGLLVQGDFLGIGAGYIVDFTSASGSGNLGLDGTSTGLVGGTGNTPFSNVTTQLENGATFNKLIFNIDVTNGLPAPTQVQLTVNYFLGGGQVFSQVFAVDVNGQNFFGIESAEGAVINSVTIQGLGGTTFAEINGWRVGGFAGGGVTPVPEPASFLLIGMGLFGIVSRVRGRRK